MYKYKHLADFSTVEFGRRLGSRDKQKRKSSTYLGDALVLGGAGAGAGVGAGVGYVANRPTTQLYRQANLKKVIKDAGVTGAEASRYRKVARDSINQAYKESANYVANKKNIGTTGYDAVKKGVAGLKNTQLKRTGLGAAIGVLGGAGIGYGIKRYQDSRKNKR